MRFSLRTLLLAALLLGSVLALRHNWEPWLLERKLVGHTDDVRSAAFSRDGQRVISVSMDGSIRVWDLASGTGTVIHRANSISLLASAEYSPNGKQAVIAGVNDSVVVCELDQQNPPRSIFSDSRNGFLNCAVFSPDGKNLLTVFPDATAWIFDSAAPYKKPRLTLPVKESLAIAAAWSPDGGSVAISDSTGTRVYDAKSGVQTAVLQYSAEISHSVFSPDGKALILTTLFGSILIWNLQTLTARDVELVTDSEWKEYFRHRSAEFSPDGAHMLEIHTHLAAIWNSENAIVTVLPHQFGVNSASYSPDGGRIVTACEDAVVRIWRRERPEEWWGFFWRPEAWLTFFLVLALLWSVFLDWPPMSRDWFTVRSARH